MFQTSVSALFFLTGFVECSVRIAIIGGGVSGSSTAYFLNEILGEKVDVTLFEGNEIGGRLATVSVGGCEYETGGAIIHEKNKYARELAEKMELNKMPDTPGEVLGLYSDNEMIFVGSKYSWLNSLKFLWRYGYDVISLQRYTDKMLESFERIYDIQDRNTSFVSLDDLMHAIDPVFLKYLDVSTFEGFREHGFSSGIIDELIQATIKCNYGQTTSVHRFVGSVSIAGAGSTLFSLEGGNKLLPQKLLAASKAKVINSFVKEIVRQREQFIVRTESNANSSGSVFDFVVLSTPLTDDPRREHKIEFVGLPDGIGIPGTYWTTVCTIVKGDINPRYFGYQTPQDVPDLVISLSDSLFNSIGKISPVHGDRSCGGVWKVFSRRRLTPEEINLVFDNVTFLEHIDWLAYPTYNVEQHNYNFTLSDGLYYTNAMEWAASAIETSIIGARNVALLIGKRIDDNSNISLDQIKSAASLTAHDEIFTTDEFPPAVEVIALEPMEGDGHQECVAMDEGVSSSSGGRVVIPKDKPSPFKGQDKPDWDLDSSDEDDEVETDVHS